MKRKPFDFRKWHRAQGEQTHLTLPGGLLIDYRAVRVTQPLNVPFAGRTLRILDDGYRWVVYAPTGARHVLTAQLDDRGEVQQIYIDVGQSSGVENGLPWIDDLYLDIVGTVEVQPGGGWRVNQTEVLDVDELDEALRRSLITPEQHALAWQEVRHILAALNDHTFAPLEIVRRSLQDPYT